MGLFITVPTSRRSKGEKKQQDNPGVGIWVYEPVGVTTPKTDATKPVPVLTGDALWDSL